MCEIIVGHQLVKSHHGNSRFEHKPNVPKDIHIGEKRVQRDYFAQMHVYDEKLFHRQYEMHM